MFDLSNVTTFNLDSIITYFVLLSDYLSGKFNNFYSDIYNKISNILSQHSAPEYHKQIETEKYHKLIDVHNKDPHRSDPSDLYYQEKLSK